MVQTTFRFKSIVFERSPTFKELKKCFFVILLNINTFLYIKINIITILKHNYNKGDISNLLRILETVDTGYQFVQFKLILFQCTVSFY